jgi:hypothetical protein
LGFDRPSWELQLVAGVQPAEFVAEDSKHIRRGNLVITSRSRLDVRDLGSAELLARRNRGWRRHADEHRAICVAQPV